MMTRPAAQKPSASATKLAVAARRMQARADAIDGPDGVVLPPLWFFTDQSRVPDPVSAIARLPEGTGIIFRDYDADDRDRRARSAADAARTRGLALLVAGDVDLALAVGAAGVHVPQGLLGQVARIRKDYPQLAVTAACHDQAALTRAARAGAHAAFLSPVFPTASHPDSATLGPLRFAAMVRAARLPVFALGGIDAKNIGRIAGSGAAGIAAIGALL